MARILVADDDALIVEVIKQKLSARGFHTMPASNGQEVLSLLALGLPDVIVLDGNMPGMTGFEVLTELKNNPKTKHIPVIMLTARKNKEDVLQSASAGVVDYIIKPFSPDDLVNRIASILTNRPLGKKNPANVSDKPITSLVQDNQEDELLHVLFVDTFEANHLTIQSSFKKYDSFTVDIVGKAKDVKTKLNNNYYRIVVIDCSQPQLDGYHLADQIRQQDRDNNYHRIIIGVGDEPKEDSQRKWLVYGMNAYYQKPLSVKTMVEILMRFKEQAMDDYV